MKKSLVASAILAAMAFGTAGAASADVGGRFYRGDLASARTQLLQDVGWRHGWRHHRVHKHCVWRHGVRRCWRN